MLISRTADRQPHSSDDARLVSDTANRLAVPRAAPADSFVLHSGLELLARTALLTFVDPSGFDAARDRIGEIADQFESFGDAVVPPRTMQFDDVGDGARYLMAAIDRGELGDVDAGAAWLGSTATPMELRVALAGSIVPRLAAAGHAPILLYLLPRVAPHGELTGQLFRQLARELARHPDWTMTWFQQRDASAPPADADALAAALVATPRLPEPPVAFIHPLMSRIDSQADAGTWLAGLTAGPCSEGDDRSRAVLRIAAWSMVCEPTRHAPYGWTHCLTMPQAVLGIADSCADPSAALAVAATYVAGFRTLADTPLRCVMDASDPMVPLADAIAEGPQCAAAAAWHGALRDPSAVMAHLATTAAVHPDAHLAKYTLACIDAADADPSARPLFMAAAAALAAWWAADDRSSAGQSA